MKENFLVKYINLGALTIRNKLKDMFNTIYSEKHFNIQ